MPPNSSERVNDKFLKPYNPSETEGRIYDGWEKSGYFNPDNLPNGKEKKPFTIMMPPPNATGVLHMGHALGLTIQDILIRYKRMRGFATLWLPGTDHAAIATQAKVEKEISKKEGKNRYDIGRKELLKRIDAFVADSRATIQKQTRILGASCDWSREAFTLDEKRNRAVNKVFKMMYDAGLIYRGHRIINWDPKGQTTISDDEIVYVEEKAPFYYFQYGPFVIGTVRPETKFGDKYVVINPDDPRYAQYAHGQKIDLEWINGPITATIIHDPDQDMTFGSGAMTITPWHDIHDFELAERFELDREQVIDERGILLPIAGEFTGEYIKKARPRIIEKLRQKGLIVRVDENYVHNIPTAERTGGIIEPQIKLQWFVDVNKEIVGRGKSLKELMLEPVRSGATKIIPEYFDKTYFHWIENLRDWCISRQIWYGHRIPVWYRGEDISVGIEPKESGWLQDEDTLDTWFSSGIWTFSTLGWPDDTEDFRRYHPTDLLETGYDILFFWIARMILMTEFTLNTIPFKSVYLHGMVRDEQGRKMSKSLGNNLEPLDIVAKFGADAARMTLIVGNTPGTDMRINEDKIKGYKHFANKLWNIARFILENAGDADANAQYTKENKNVRRYFDQIIVKEVTKNIEEYRIDLAADTVYHYAWHRFADMILEHSKTVFADGTPEEIASQKKLLLYILTDLLKLLHPFMPFITEEIYQSLPTRDAEFLMVAQWPEANAVTMEK